MATQQKLQNIFRLIRLLNTPPAKDVPQLRRILGVAQSTLYRDIKILEELGYPVETDDRDRKYLKFTIPKHGNGVLTLEDVEYLQTLLDKEKQHHARAALIAEKFRQHLDLIPLADALPQLHQNYVLQFLRTGIHIGRCVKLCRYRSLTSNTTKDRIIEPLEITEDERYLIAWDLEEDAHRQFKINRIEDVELLDQAVLPGRTGSPMDLFGLTGERWLEVRMKLSPIAHHLLLEEFPLSRPFTRKVNGVVIFEGMVRDWKGIGRFVLGLPGEVEVLAPEEFRGYLVERRGRG